MLRPAIELHTNKVVMHTHQPEYAERVYTRFEPKHLAAKLYPHLFQTILVVVMAVAVVARRYLDRLHLLLIPMAAEETGSIISNSHPLFSPS